MSYNPSKLFSHIQWQDNPDVLHKVMSTACARPARVAQLWEGLSQSGVTVHVALNDHPLLMENVLEDLGARTTALSASDAAMVERLVLTYTMFDTPVVAMSSKRKM